MDKDKLVEMQRYDARAQQQLCGSGAALEVGRFGSCAGPEYLRAPYIAYEKCVSESINPQDQILELAAGSGLHTWALAQTGARVTATDISPNSLKLLEQRIWSGDVGVSVTTVVADMESLPFKDDSFDVVVCAGGLSYGEPTLVDGQIKRVLRPGGLLICVDSLNHNPIYRLNRWLHYWQGARTKSTLLRIPDLSRIESLSSDFASVRVQYFGALTFAMPAIARLCGPKRAQAVSDRFDRLIGVKLSAFKFVLTASGLNIGPTCKG